MVRVVAVVGAALTLVTSAAAPAWAHGGTPDASNFRSRVAGIVRMDGGVAADEVDAPAGVTWRILGADALLQVHNAGREDIVIMGYDGEPFLRVGPAGTFENRRSPAAYLNAERFARVDVPADADPAAEPRWRRVSSAPRWQWHDHRIHWMGPAPPPQVLQRPDEAHTVLEWSVPFRVSDRDLAVTGVLRWIPPGAVWPWLLGAVGAVSLPVLALLAAGGGSRWRTRVTAAVTALVATGCVTVAVGDVLAVPASVGANIWAVTQAAAPAAVAALLAGSSLRHVPGGDQSDAAPPLLLATAVLALGCGVVRLAQLQSSQIVNALPSPVVRAIVATSLAAVVPAAIMMLPAVRSSERQ
jgi:hypothetical protein